MKTRDSFYDSKKWHSVKNRVLRRDNYQCQESKRYSAIPVPAQIVHHIFPREYYPELSLVSWNLISLSKAEHNKMHDRDSDRLTAKGIELAKRICRKQGINAEELLKRML